ncbi:unnamed protein product [Victoria cruziana]
MSLLIFLLFPPRWKPSLNPMSSLQGSSNNQQPSSFSSYQNLYWTCFDGGVHCQDLELLLKSGCWSFIVDNLPNPLTGLP